MSKGDKQRPVNKKRFDKNFTKIHNDYYCNACDLYFKLDDADWKQHGTGNHVTDMSCCPQCGSCELTEL